MRAHLQMQGLALLERTLGPEALAPNQIVVDTHRPGGAFAPESLAAQRRLVAALATDLEARGALLARLAARFVVALCGCACTPAQGR